MRQRLMTGTRQVSATVCLLSILISPRHLLLAFVLRDNDVFQTQRLRANDLKTVQVCVI